RARHHVAKGRQHAEEEDSRHPESDVLALDRGEGPGTDEPPANGRVEKSAPELSRAPVDRNGAGYPEAPGDQEDGEWFQGALVGEERGQQDEDIGKGRRKKILDDDRSAIHREDEQRGLSRHPGEQALDQRASTVATASTATPSP